MSNHISFDLETMGIEHDAHILSIGAVKFDLNGTIDREGGFYRRLQVSGDVHEGSVSISTIQWWMAQSDAARMEAFGSSIDRFALVDALYDFSTWVSGKGYHWWQRGDRDALWLQSAYRRVGMDEPFQFWELNDQRTLCKWSSADMPDRRGTHHNALDDAIYQAECIITALRNR